MVVDLTSREERPSVADALTRERLPAEVEIALAEMETRLRSAILRVVRPGLDQISDLAARIQDVRGTIDGHDRALFTVEKLSVEVVQQKELTMQVWDQINVFQQQWKDFEHTTTSDLHDIRVKAQLQDRKIESQDSELRQLAREAARTWTEVQQLAEQHETASRVVYDHIAASEKRSDNARQDIIDMVRELQRHREDLLEDLFAEDKGLTKLGRDLADLSRFTAPLPGVITSMEQVQERVEQVSQEERALEARFENSERVLLDLNKKMQAKLGVLREDIKQDQNRLIAHNATIMRDIRQDFVDEITAASKVRTEIMHFQTNIDKICRDIAEALEKEQMRIDDLHRELVQDIEEIQKRRKKDRLGFESDIQDARRELAVEQAVSAETRGKVEYLSRIMGLMLESERVISAVALQDLADRGLERWLAPPSEKSRGPAPPLSPEEVEQRLTRQPWRQEQELCSLDTRKGFALCEYTPGRVPFGGTLFDRREILLIHYKLLQKAHGAFVTGPSLEIASLEGLNQAGKGTMHLLRHVAPVASGFALTAAPLATVWDKEDMTEDAKAYPRKPGAADGHRQRPGSQDQPQAVGSRGSALGPLGETEPPPSEQFFKQPSARNAPASTVPMKLPRISGGVGGVDSVPGTTSSTFASTGLSGLAAAMAGTGSSFRGSFTSR